MKCVTGSNSTLARRETSSALSPDASSFRYCHSHAPSQTQIDLCVERTQQNKPARSAHRRRDATQERNTRIKPEGRRRGQRWRAGERGPAESQGWRARKRGAGEGTEMEGGREARDTRSGGGRHATQKQAPRTDGGTRCPTCDLWTGERTWSPAWMAAMMRFIHPDDAMASFCAACCT